MDRNGACERLRDLLTDLRNYIEAEFGERGAGSREPELQHESVAKIISNISGLFEQQENLLSNHESTAQYLASVLANNRSFLESINNQKLKETALKFIADFAESKAAVDQHERIRIRIDVDRRSGQSPFVINSFKAILGSILISMAGSGAYEALSRTLFPPKPVSREAEKDPRFQEIPDVPASIPIDYAVVDVDNLRLRSEPSLDAKVLRLLDRGTKLLRHSVRDDWVMVSVLFPDPENAVVEIGWVHQKYISTVPITQIQVFSLYKPGSEPD
ncbi:SH3 domain-containing protein [Sinorhizobium meliloti]|jgi:hypothetical protein|uniref:SH3 domain-containing protein n=2 Tax=Rhizobium meliloti TaxID=382 RepID=UPI000FD3FE1C|nr:SH3 domain-containing protein [Sinorhizobium meliloti]MDW9376930.1 hypothetical protein [Sinorhizobium meliloti]MDW9831054.1 hypothetical protein [Sinorhizobium meliloti]QGJ78520.1 hypothetical protein C3L21_32685 [Sinorhizobium meliloti]RVE80206.1 hypothetical protein CN235_34265 [Sinorhizobium meliloti]RVH04174.1 hypothetical protein CN210_17910 [Sinorhizobium meliloti]